MSILKVKSLFFYKNHEIKIKTFLHKYWTSGVNKWEKYSNRDDHCIPETTFPSICN
jgi:hypothetical protein